MTMITDKTFSAILFLQRIIFSLAFIFLATGEALHINAFVQNGIDIGLPYARIICTSAVILTFLASLFLLAGVAFRFASAVMIFISLFSGFFFFAGGVNKVNILGVMFALTILISFLISGPGKISLQYFIEQKKLKNNKRISFR